MSGYLCPPLFNFAIGIGSQLVNLIFCFNNGFFFLCVGIPRSVAYNFLRLLFGAADFCFCKSLSIFFAFLMSFFKGDKSENYT